MVAGVGRGEQAAEAHGRPPRSWRGACEKWRGKTGSANASGVAVAEIGEDSAVSATLLAMAVSPKASIEIETELLERARRVARERGVAMPQLLRVALEHELGPEQEGEQPPVTCIGMFESESGDLSARASRDEFEPRPFR